MGSREGKNSAWSGGRSTVAAGLALVLLVGLPAPAGAHHNEFVDKTDRGVTERVSISSSGEPGDADSGYPCDAQRPSVSASDDGRFVAFRSIAGNLHPSDTNGSLVADIFVYDRVKKTTHLVSAMPNGLAFNPGDLVPEVDGLVLPCDSRGVPDSRNPAISGNGRYVAFTSTLPLTGADDPAATLATEFPFLIYRVYVRDLKKGTTELVSSARGGEPMEGSLPHSGFYSVSISDDGRLVAFTSQVTNLVGEHPCESELAPGVSDPTASPRCIQVYVRDLKKQETRLVSTSSSGEPADHIAWEAEISDNGRYVVFSSSASNLHPDDDTVCPPLSDNNGPSCSDIFLHDLRDGKTELISLSRDSGSPDRSSRYPQISADGKAVLFMSNGTDLVPANPGANANCPSIYVRDLRTERTERVSTSSTGTMLSHSHRHFTIADGGRYVSFDARNAGIDCRPSDLPEPIESHEYGRVVLDRKTGQADYRIPPIEGGPDHEAWKVGGNGKFLVGATSDGGMVDSDNNDAFDVFVRHLGDHPLGGSLITDGPSSSRRAITLPVDMTIGKNGVAILPDRHDDALVPGLGAEIMLTRIAHRPDLDDLYVKIDVDRLATPTSVTGLLGTSMLYGARFTIEGSTYELRAHGLGGPLLHGGGTFGLFDCTEGCTEIVELKGGYGTVGENVVASIPLRHLGLQDGGEITDIEVFAGPGSYLLGITKLLDVAGR